jgi:YegS/Rv2252/BmrU family lipid kinase
MERIADAIPSPLEVARTSGPGDAERFAREAAGRGCGPIVCVGGDGTLREVASGIMQSPARPVLGIVPAGSGNDFARTLGLPRDPVKAARVAIGDSSGPVDVGTCNAEYFLNVAGVGLDTEAARAVNTRSGNRSRGRATYVIQALRELRHYVNPDFTITLDDEVIATRSILVEVANGCYFAGGMKVAPAADPADGWLDICIGGDLSRREALMLLPAIFLGMHGRHHKVSFHRAQRIRLEGPEGLAVQLDGEVIGSLPAEIGIMPGALQIAGFHAPRP